MSFQVGSALSAKLFSQVQNLCDQSGSAEEQSNEPPQQPQPAPSFHGAARKALVHKVQSSACLFVMRFGQLLFKHPKCHSVKKDLLVLEAQTVQ